MSAAEPTPTGERPLCVYVQGEHRCHRPAFRYVDSDPACSLHWQRILGDMLQVRATITISRLDWANFRPGQRSPEQTSSE